MKGMASAAEGGGDPLLIPQYGSTAEAALGDEDQPYALSLLRSSCDSCWKKKVQIQACLSLRIQRSGLARRPRTRISNPREEGRYIHSNPWRMVQKSFLARQRRLLK